MKSIQPRARGSSIGKVARVGGFSHRIDNGKGTSTQVLQRPPNNASKFLLGTWCKAPNCTLGWRHSFRACVCTARRPLQSRSPLFLVNQAHGARLLLCPVTRPFLCSWTHIAFCSSCHYSQPSEPVPPGPFGRLQKGAPSTSALTEIWLRTWLPLLIS